MSLTEEQISTIRAALIAGRAHYCGEQAEFGYDGIKRPEPDIKAAMEIMGMQWQGDVIKIYHEDPWNGNEQFEPAP